MKTITIGIGLAIALSSAAHATSWYILDGSDVKCKEAAKLSPAVESPNAFEKGLRAAGHFKQTVVTRNDDGTIRAVMVSSTDNLSMGFFPTKEDCEWVRQSGLQKGYFTNPNELK